MIGSLSHLDVNVASRTRHSTWCEDWHLHHAEFPSYPARRDVASKVIQTHRIAFDEQVSDPWGVS